MHIEGFSNGNFYMIACPEGTTVIRCSGQRAPVGSEGLEFLVVLFGGQDIRIPSEPSLLLPLLAESGRCGLSLIGGPVPEEILAGAVCPNCGEHDMN